MIARICHDADGTCDLIVTGDKISVQTWRRENDRTVKALIKVYKRDGAMVRALHLSAVHHVDVDYEASP